MTLNVPATLGTGTYYAVTVSSAPSAQGSWNSISTAFSGDLSKGGIPISYTISGAASLGQPTTGYRYTPECSPVAIYVRNNSGWNNGTADNVGRTAATVFRCKIDNYGQGDAVVFNGEAFATGARAGATNFLANPACTICNGNVSAGSDGVYLNPFEVLMTDAGFDVAGVGYVVNHTRTNNTGALGVYWYGFASQTKSDSTKPVDAHFIGSGPAVVGVDLSGATVTTAFKSSGFSVNGSGDVTGKSFAMNAKPAVTGSRGGNAALASLLTALANIGLITDSTTA